MNNDKINRLIEELELEMSIKLEDIPDIDLYMDQVIQLFEGTYTGGKRRDDDKILTKTMINNYAKAKLLMTINKKKYSKEHIILMSLIYNLKGGLSIGDIKSVLDNIVKKSEHGEDYPLREVYNSYLDISEKSIEKFKEDVELQIEFIDTICKSKGFREYEDKLLLVLSLVNMSNMYRRVSEKIVDEYFLAEGNDK